MKNLFFILIIISINLGASAQSNKNGSISNKTKKHLIKTNVLGMFTLFYEHPIAEKMTLQAGLQYNPKTIPKKDFFVTSIAPEIRYYFIQNQIMPGGLFAGIYAKYQYATETKSEKSANIQSIASGITVGFQYLFKNGLTTEIFAGGGYNLWKMVDTNYPESFPETDYQFDIRLGLGIGYAF